MERFTRIVRLGLWLGSALIWHVTDVRADEDHDRKQELANPVADLISFPVQANFDENIGRLPFIVGGGVRYYSTAAPNGPEGLGYRAFITLILPKTVLAQRKAAKQ